MTDLPVHALSTNLDVQVSVDPVVAGVLRGRLANEWLFCPFRIEPMHPSGVSWKATFNAKDEPRLTKNFDGVAPTRRRAKQVVIDVLTSHMAAVVKQRAARTGLRVVAPGGVTAPAPGVLGWILRLVVRVRTWLRKKAT